MVLYADDSTLYYSASTCCKLKSVLSQDLKAVVNWVTANRLVLNLSKTVRTVFGSRPGADWQPGGSGDFSNDVSQASQAGE